MKTIILASSSESRRLLLNKLSLPFQQAAPDIDETPYADEIPEALVQRLAEMKARALATQFPNALIIGADSVAVIDTHIVSKPLNHEDAVQQLRAVSGRSIRFLTGLCLYNTATQQAQITYEPYEVVFRKLSDTLIENYLRKEQPYHAAGSIKAEGLGIILFSAMRGDDPNALIGLPLIKLVTMLQNEGINILE